MSNGKIREIQVVEASGTPYEIGVAHGKAAKEKILRSIEGYTEMFMDWANLSWEEAKNRSRKYVPIVEKADPDLIEEVRGVADGAGLDFYDIMTLNARSEVLFTQNMVSDACTSFAVAPRATSTGHTYVGENWDWQPFQIENMLILKIKQNNNKPNIFMVTEAGIIGKIGMNSAGVAVCLNAFAVPGNADGLPLHFTLRRVLDSCTIAETQFAMNAQRLASPGNYMLGHKDGTIFDAERTPDDWAYLCDTTGVLGHANHIEDIVLSSKVQDQTRFILPDSYIRSATIKRLLEAKNGEIDVAYIQQCLRDHHQKPNSVCHHVNPKEASQFRFTTVVSLIMDLTADEVWLTLGPPCESEYQHFDVKFD